MNRKALATVAVAGSILLGSQAQATLIDFEDLGVAPGSGLHPADGVTTASGGFDFDSSALHLHFHNPLKH